jgi:hypothetical protein
MTRKLEFEQWFKNIEKDFLTIDSISNLQLGDEINLLCFDRNFRELMSKTKNPIPIDLFFKKNYKILYKHNKDLQGQASWSFGQSNQKLNLEPFEFHLEYKDNHWYPLHNGKLPDSDPQHIFNFDNTLKNYKEYPPETRIGWRGPMIDISKLDNSILIYNE